MDNQTPTDNFNNQYYNSSPNNATQIEQDEYDPIPPIFSFSFRGRWGRLSYINALVTAMGISFAVMCVLGIVLALTIGLNSINLDNPSDLSQNFLSGTGIVFLIVIFALFILYMIWAIRFSVLRLHDLGWSGWWVLLLTFGAFIPFVGFLASIASLIIYYCLPGTPEENPYGRPVPAGSKLGLIILCVLMALYAILIALIIFGVGLAAFNNTGY
ncbi:DUF805 domain-containing protein [Neisseria sp. Ec49-e6-T10]|uniref:DUF805 domain-containing protein n=1 Tax=Neisseria sp. Ec49-e6-T10 TaxID=3140744 RepID=UPI003EBA6769